jgi:hypothetical protein
LTLSTLFCCFVIVRYVDAIADECSSDKPPTAAAVSCMRKAACFEVLDALFGTLNAGDVRGDVAEGSGAIEVEYVKARKMSKKGTEFYKFMCNVKESSGLRGTLQLAKEWSCCGRAGCKLREARRQLACAAFNALGAMHMCAQPTEKLAAIVTKFLLKDDVYSALTDSKTPLHEVFSLQRAPANEGALKREGAQW